MGFAPARVAATMGRTFPHWPEEGETFPTPGTLDYWTWFPGLGFGDVKLMAMVGACVGPARRTAGRSAKTAGWPKSHRRLLSARSASSS